MLCAVGFMSAITVGILDKYGMEQLGQSATLRQDSKKLVIFDFVFLNPFMHYCLLYETSCGGPKGRHSLICKM